MLVDGAWECRAGVLYRVVQTQGGVRHFEATPAPQLREARVTVVKRLTSVSKNMDGLDLSHTEEVGEELSMC